MSDKIQMTEREKREVLFTFRKLEYQVQLAIKAVENDELVYSVPPKYNGVISGYEIGDFCISERNASLDQSPPMLHTSGD